MCQNCQRDVGGGVRTRLWWALMWVNLWCQSVVTGGLGEEVEGGSSVGLSLTEGTASNYRTPTGTRTLVFLTSHFFRSHTSEKCHPSWRFGEVTATILEAPSITAEFSNITVSLVSHCRPTTDHCWVIIQWFGLFWFIFMFRYRKKTLQDPDLDSTHTRPHVLDLLTFGRCHSTS